MATRAADLRGDLRTGILTEVFVFMGVDVVWFLTGLWGRSDLRHGLGAQPGTIHDNGRDDHECGGNKTADCAENKHDGCDPQARPESTDKHPNPKGTVSKAQPQCQESGGPQSSFGRRIAFTGTPKGISQNQGGKKIKQHCDAKES